MVQLSIIVRNHVQSLSVGKYYTANAVVFHAGVFEPPVDGVYVLTIYG